MIHTFSVSPLQLKRLWRHNESAIGLARSPSRSWFHIDSGREINGSHPATQTRDPKRDKILARSDHPTASDTCRRQVNVFGYEVPFSLSGVPLVSQNQSYKLQIRLLVVCAGHPPKFKKKVIQSVL